MPGVSLLPGTWSDRIPRDQVLSPPKIHGSRGYPNTHTYTAPFLPGGEETPIQVFSLGKEARESGDGKGKGRKRSPPSSACPCDRLPCLQIPAWDPHPCSPPPTTTTPSLLLDLQAHTPQHPSFGSGCSSTWSALPDMATRLPLTSNVLSSKTVSLSRFGEPTALTPLLYHTVLTAVPSNTCSPN